jgi:5-methylcytosine-specific restriction endonuclease McrA
MRLVSHLFPEQFPYHPNWKAAVTHPAVAARSPSLDHIEAIAHGGAALDTANFATACWPCNSKKGDLSLSALGWSMVSPAEAHWYGLADLYPALWKAAGEPKLATQDKQWLNTCRRLYDA